MIAVDTSVWIDWLQRRSTEGARKLEWISNRDAIALGDIVLLEVLQGARDDLHARKIERLLERYLPIDMMSQKLGIQVAANYRTLRARGITIRKTIDLIIGTWCIEHDCPLLHSDRDFAPMVEHLGLREY